MPELNNKRIAKNAILLTLRMAIVAVVGLYTSRIVLLTLGDLDYGIYGVVGGVVAIASFLNTSMAGATSRFISYELGKGNSERLRRIFSTALIIHFIISLIVLVMAETIGLWFLNNKMVFPPERMFAVNVLYQLSIASMIVSFTQVPYTAIIIAYERMHIYAYFEIINIVLKLLIVYMLVLVPYDKLIFYGSLTFAVSVLNALFYRYYSNKNFEESHLFLPIDRAVAKEMLSYTGVDLYGHICVIARNQGIPILLNMFFGVLANTGASLAVTVNGILCGIIASISSAFDPQITIQYACGKIKSMSTIMVRSFEFSSLVFAMAAIPIALETHRLLYLWLGQVPEYAAIFLKFVMLATIIDIYVRVANTGIHATGSIKRISFISGTMYLFTPIAGYIIFKLGADAWWIYAINCIMLSIVCIIGWFILKKQIATFDIKEYVGKLVRTIIAISLSLFLTQLICGNYLKFAMSYDCGVLSSILRLFLVGLISMSLISVFALSFVFNKSERAFVYQIIINRIRLIIKT